MSYFVFGSINSLNFNTIVADSNQFDGARKSVEKIKVPGRNGELSISDGSYENIEIIYTAYIKGDVKRNVDALKAALNSQSGYLRLEDDFRPETFRLARYMDAFTVDASDKAGAAMSIRFDCDPRRFLKSGEQDHTFTASGQINNTTRFEAKPLIRAYGTGTFTIQGKAVRINSASEYTDLDCDLQEAYKGTESCNGNIVLTNGAFPALVPGMNNIYLSGITRVDIKPRWWTL